MPLTPFRKKISCWILALLIPAGVLAYTAADYTNAGLQFYAARNYAQAVLYFSAALGMNPSDNRALQGRANSYYFLGKNQEALNDYEKLLMASPSAPLSQFAQALRSKIASQAQVPGAASVPVSANGAALLAPQKPAGLGLRLETSYGTLNFADFIADSETGKKDASQIQQSDPSFQYDSTVPSGYVMVGVEPVAQVGSNLEIGLPFQIMPAGTFTVSSQDNSGYSDSTAFSINAFSVGLTGRLLFGQGPVRIFAAAGGLLAPVGINYSDFLNIQTPSPVNYSQTGSFSQMAFGGQGQLGLDFHVGDPFVVSLAGGYTALSASGFKGSVTTSGNVPTATDQGRLGVYDSPNGKKIIFLKDGDPEPLNFRPLVVDLSGLLAGIHLSVFF